jgi:hypothetical protein
MPVVIQYLQGYGWHMGRLVLWPLLLVAGAGLTFGVALAGQLASAILKLPVGYALYLPFLIPLVFALLFRSRIVRKLAGEAYVVNLPSTLSAQDGPWLISRGHRHFRALLMLDLIIWGSSFIAQISIAASPFYSAYLR